jgi:hypothetical protein
MFSAEILIHLGLGIAWITENFPDDPRLGRLRPTCLRAEFLPATAPHRFPQNV